MSRSGLLEKIDLAPKGRSHTDWLDYWTSICATDYAVFLDSDVEIINEFWLERLVLVAEAERCAMVTSEILNKSYTTYRDFTGVTPLKNLSKTIMTDLGKILIALLRLSSNYIQSSLSKN
jgi:hypothetical protein